MPTVTAVQRPFLVTFQGGSTMPLTSTEVQRLIDAGLYRYINGRLEGVVDSAAAGAVIVPATIGGGPAFVVERENRCPNLDNDPAVDLMAFWSHHRNGRNSRDLFPDGGKGVIRATRDLAEYAANKHAATYCRLRGDIMSAANYESICDRLYERLPYWARSW